MTAAAALSIKGQTTVPKPVRDFLQVEAGDKLEYIIRDDGMVELTALQYPLDDLVGCLPPPKKTLTVEQMNDVICNMPRV